MMVRIVNIRVDIRHLEAYKAALKDGIDAALRLEPGVHTLYAVVAKDDPARFTILEVYADQAAYEVHLQTPHFLKYKADTQAMVESLELVDVVPLVPELKTINL